MSKAQKLAFLVNAAAAYYGYQDTDFDVTPEVYFSNIVASFSALPEAEVDELYQLMRETTVF